MTIYQLFSACVPELSMPEEIFEELAGLDKAEVLTWEDGGETAGFAVVEGEALRLLCVDPAHRGRGGGSELLRRAEALILSRGGREIVAGGAHSQLFIGATESARNFLARRGFETVGQCEEMTGDLRMLLPASSVPAPDDVQYGWYQGGLERLRRAVRTVDEDWPQYFTRTEGVFVAEQNGEIASFCFADAGRICLLSDGKNKVGIPGCVGTVPAFRRQGIGLKMVALACEALRDRGCDTAFIHYTGVAPWYARLGFKTIFKQYFMRKNLI